LQHQSVRAGAGAACAAPAKSIDTTTVINRCLLFFFSNILRSEILPLSIATDFYSTSALPNRLEMKNSKRKSSQSPRRITPGPISFPDPTIIIHRSVLHDSVSTPLAVEIGTGVAGAAP
jgi:hypothetical protein